MKFEKKGNTTYLECLLVQTGGGGYSGDHLGLCQLDKTYLYSNLGEKFMEVINA